MPANLYGVSNPVIAPVYFTLTGNTSIALPAGTETVIATTPALAAISSGFYYPAIIGAVLVYCGSGALTNFVISARIGAGADFFQQSFQATLFPLNGIPIIPFVAYGPSSSIPWQGAGSTLSVTATGTGNASQATYPGSYFFASLYRAPDQ